MTPFHTKEKGKLHRGTKSRQTTGFPPLVCYKTGIFKFFWHSGWIWNFSRDSSPYGSVRALPKGITERWRSSHGWWYLQWQYRNREIPGENGTALPVQLHSLLVCLCSCFYCCCCCYHPLLATNSSSFSLQQLSRNSLGLHNWNC